MLGIRALMLGMAVAIIGMPAMLPAPPAQAQSASRWLDASFGDGGIVTTDFGNRDEHLRAVAVQPDGKIVAAGYTQQGHDFDFAVVRYTATGELDDSFGNGGKVTTEFGHHAHIHGMALQPGGKIVAVGHTYTHGNDNFLVARYKANGSLDASFAGDGKVALDFSGGLDYAFGVAVQPDEKIVVAGTAFVGSTYDFAVARYSTDGSLDTSFGNGGKVTTEFGPTGDRQNDQAQALALQSDGKIVVAGYSSTKKPGEDASTDFALARYNADGSLDASFGTDGKVTTHFGNGNDRIYKVEALPNGKIVAMGRSFSATNRDVDFEVARYHANGSLDTSFGNGGKVRTDLGYGEYGYAGAVQSDGKIVVAGYIYDDAPASQDQLVVRYNVDGSRDTSFGNDGVVRTDVGGDDQVYSVALQPDGKILAAGNSGIGGDFDLVVARYHGRAPQPPPPPPSPSPSPPPPDNTSGSSGGGGFGPALIAPSFVDGFRTTRPLPATARDGDAVGDPVAATHPEDDVITYSLSGAQAGLFTIDEETGQIRLGEGVSLEAGQSFTVNLTATDSTGTGAIIIVDIEVVEGPADPYDLNRNGAIELDEVMQAVSDYFAGLIELEAVLELVSRYFAQ